MTGELFNSLRRYGEIIRNYDKYPRYGPDGRLIPSSPEQMERNVMDQLGVDSMPELETKMADQERALEYLETLKDMPSEVTDGNIRVTDKERNGGRDCRLRTYREGCAPPHSTPHHVVADRVFRKPGSSETYPGGIPHADGYCICVSNGTPIRRGSGLNEHGRIHILQDAGETYLGDNSSPKHTATLGDLENLGVAAAAAVTGCDPIAMKVQLRAYHQGKGLPSPSRWRADPLGRYDVNGVGVGPGSRY
ncbi:MAG: hypothetical protein HC869_05345 [Rhodospirillales bacterium]|nr:hypothetical protein [Rhodospirillales bacterium]